MEEVSLLYQSIFIIPDSENRTFKVVVPKIRSLEKKIFPIEDIK